MACRDFFLGQDDDTASLKRTLGMYAHERRVDSAVRFILQMRERSANTEATHIAPVIGHADCIARAHPMAADSVNDLRVAADAVRRAVSDAVWHSSTTKLERLLS